MLSPGLKLAFIQADFLVNIILLIGRTVKRNLRFSSGFSVEIGLVLYAGTNPLSGCSLLFFPAGAGGAPAGKTPG